ncbi:RNA 2',3'-cyclic phosphodiesterase [Humidesulfovibrio idahonensis]
MSAKAVSAKAAPKATTVRCFAGLPLPEDWRAALSRVAGRLAARFSSRIAWTAPDNWHITLKFLGEVECARLPEISAALRAIVFSPLELRLGGAGAFSASGPLRAPRTLWAALAQGDEAVTALAARVEAALAPCGFASGGRGFRPHVTLGRVKAAAADEDWGLVDRELGAEVFAPARVEDIVLWRSILGPGEPKYVALECFPARGQGAGPAEGTA